MQMSAPLLHQSLELTLSIIHTTTSCFLIHQHILATVLFCTTLHHPLANLFQAASRRLTLPESMSTSLSNIRLVFHPDNMYYYDLFCHYSFFPATLYSSEMDDGPVDRVPLESIVSHVAWFTFSPDCAVVLNLSRVSSFYSHLHISNCYRFEWT
jgi:hypothetical protein